MAMSRLLKIQNCKTIAIFSISALALSACSPLAPSVSKLANTASQKTDPTDGATKDNNLTIPTDLRSANDDPSLRDGFETNIKTEIMPLSKFKRDWISLNQVNPAFQLGVPDFEEFLKNKLVIFSIDDERIKGNEATLLQSRTRVLLIVNADAGSIIRKKLNDVTVNLVWIKNERPHWELAINKPSLNTGDPILDSEGEKILNHLRDHLIGVGIVFSK